MDVNDGSRRSPGRRRRLLWAARLGLFFASLCAALLLLVLLDPVLPGVEWPPDSPSQAFHHTSRPGVWVARGYEYGPHLVYTDAAGWRTAPPAAAEEARRTAPPDLRPRGHRFRMAVMGDSFVEAVQVTWEDTFVARLQARSAGRTEVLNRGDGAYSPLLTLLRWRGQVAHERPTHLLLLLFANDVEDDLRYTASAMRRHGGGGDETPPGAEAGDVDQLYWKKPPPRPWVQGGSRSAKFYRRWRDRAAVVTAGWRQRWPGARDRASRGWRDLNPALTHRYLRELAADAREAGVEFTLSAVPSKWEARDLLLGAPEPRVRLTFADSVAAWAAANDVRYVDLQPAFREAAARGERLFFERDSHFTEAGHAVAADVFAAVWPELFAASGAGSDE